MITTNFPPQTATLTDSTLERKSRNCKLICLHKQQNTQTPPKKKPQTQTTFFFKPAKEWLIITCRLLKKFPGHGTVPARRLVFSGRKRLPVGIFPSTGAFLPPREVCINVYRCNMSTGTEKKTITITKNKHLTLFEAIIETICCGNLSLADTCTSKEWCGRRNVGGTVSWNSSAVRRCAKGRCCHTSIIITIIFSLNRHQWSPH